MDSDDRILCNEKRKYGRIKNGSASFRKEPFLFLGRCAAKLFFISPHKGGIVLKTALGRGFHYGDALRDQRAGKKKPFACNIAVYGIAGFFFEFTHHMVSAEKKLSGKHIYREIFIQVPVDVADQLLYLGIGRVGFAVCDIYSF